MATEDWACLIIELALFVRCCSCLLTHWPRTKLSKISIVDDDERRKKGEREENEVQAKHEYTYRRNVVASIQSMLDNENRIICQSKYCSSTLAVHKSERNERRESGGKEKASARICAIYDNRCGDQKQMRWYAGVCFSSSLTHHRSCTLVGSAPFTASIHFSNLVVCYLRIFILYPDRKIRVVSSVYLKRRRQREGSEGFSSCAARPLFFFFFLTIRTFDLRVLWT